MQEQIDKNIESLTDKMLEDMPIVSPSLDFTNGVMSQVEALESKKLTTYKPLINKRLWFLVGFVLIAITGYLFTNNAANETTLFHALDFSKLTDNTLTQSLSGFTLSKTLMYTIVGFALMVCIQVPLLKHYFDKRLSL